MKKKKMVKRDIAKEALALHKKMGGKVRILPAMRVRNREELSLVYTPGVGFVSSYVAKHTKESREYTIRGKMIAVISDGSAVLGLGNIGPIGALPVMEGKAVLFKELAGVDAFPIVLNTAAFAKASASQAESQEEIDFIVKTIIAIAPGFGGINLEDFAAPKCFEIEERVKKALDIPVMHDDQHGTAIVVVAGLINAAKVVKKPLARLKVVIVGSGAAGTAVAKLLLLAGVEDIIVLDSKGIIDAKRPDKHKVQLARKTNPRKVKGSLREALSGADAVVGVSGPGILKSEHIKLMAPQAIVFGLANPVPEILPAEAKKGGAMVVATGRSDFPNQINNSLAFPGVFRGALDNKISKITDEMKLKAAKNLAALVKNPTTERIIPGPFDKGVVPAVARAIK